jgi:hypothetical protein
MLNTHASYQTLKAQPMNAKQLQDLMDWLRQKLQETDSKIKESQVCHNYGKATQYEGKKEAYLECLRKLNLNTL